MLHLIDVCGVETCGFIVIDGQAGRNALLHHPLHGEFAFDVLTVAGFCKSTFLDLEQERLRRIELALDLLEIRSNHLLVDDDPAAEFIESKCYIRPSGALSVTPSWC